MTDKKPATYFADGFDEAIVGVSENPDGTLCVLYDEELCIEALISQGMSYEEASDHFSYNTLRGSSYMGPGAPRFITTVRGDGARKRGLVSDIVDLYEGQPGGQD
jgi:hypothetical protein